MQSVGKISGIFRYPVKSMLGEELDTSTLDVNGMPGDRIWGVRDEQRGDFFVGKRCAELMGCAAESVEATGVPRIRLPNGESLSVDAPAAAERLTEVLGREVSLWPVVPEARKAEPKDGLSLADEMQAMMAREGDEPEPDFSDPPPELLEVYARGGPFFDAFPLLVISQKSIESIAAAAPESRIDLRRFRPSLSIETDAPGAFPEQAWIGRRLRIGDATIKIQMTCIRCVMTTHGFADLPKDPRIMRTLVKEAEGNLGVYASIEIPGTIHRDDRVELLD